MAKTVVPGLHFQNIHMPQHDFFVEAVDPIFNKLAVHIRHKINPESYWTESDWNLEHTQTAFDRGEYYITKTTTNGQ
jgi:hypothetical protein